MCCPLMVYCIQRIQECITLHRHNIVDTGLQWNLCIMDTLGQIHKCPDYQGVLIIQVSLYDKAPFGTITKCVYYADVLIFKQL